MKYSTVTTSSFSAMQLHVVVTGFDMICTGIAEDDEVVAVEYSIDVGNILVKSCIYLWPDLWSD